MCSRGRIPAQLSFMLVLVSFLTYTPCLRAQKKELAQARSYIKSGKNFDKAERLMNELLAKDAANRQNPKIHEMLYLAVRKQYEAGNEKLYLKQKFDTAMLFNLTKRMFDICQRLDSIDAQPDKKGRVRPEYRKKHARELDEIRQNLYLGGRFFLAKSCYQVAFNYFDTYLDCARQPLFTDYRYLQNDSLMKHAAYWSTYTGFKEQLPEHILKYAQLALQDTVNAQFTLQYMAEAYRMNSNDSLYVQTLTEGFRRFPEHVYFYPRLLDLYNSREQYAQALELSEEALSHNPENELFIFGKSTVLLNMGYNEESLALSDSLISRNADMSEPYFNAATAILNQIVPLENNSRKNRKEINNLYRKARPYMEHYRMLAPQKQDKWAPALYKIYLNLNMGKQFDEIDKILKK